MKTNLDLLLGYAWIGSHSLKMFSFILYISVRLHINLAKYLGGRGAIVQPVPSHYQDP